MTAISTQPTKALTLKWRQILTLQAAVLLIAACGLTGSQTGTPQPTATASPTAGVTPLSVAVSTLYVSIDGAYSIRYPATWQRVTDAPFFLAGPPKGSMSKEDLVFILPFHHVDRSDYIDELTALLANSISLTNIQVAMEPNAITLGKNTWVTLKASYDDTSNNQTVAARIYVADFGDYTYAFDCEAETTNDLDRLDTDYCKPMLATLIFMHCQPCAAMEPS